ncbi:mechanosensitive ion channel family protein [Agaribacterium haliotis]|uniref:mechanosensitive ion channel family protein n=1 Tax=Agaribacterium haliotis TaxID=2013869 RepID=UPI000BB58AD0|nr:mechanosensitive ion channel family protein [Agaribacterium haliotis]
MRDSYEQLRQWLAAMLGHDQLWMIECFVLVFLTLLAAVFVSRGLKGLEQKAKKTQTLWDDALFSALGRPLKWLVWVIGLSAAAQIAAVRSESIILSSIEHLRYVGIVVLVSWFLLRFIRRVEKNFRDPKFCHKPVDETTAVAVGKLLRVSVFITSVLILLQYFDVEIRGILAFGGIGGIAVGFAAKDLLANFFGGLMIYMDRPFAVGDWIRSHDKEIEGTVEDIGWRLTRIRTFDKRPLYVPNSTFTQIAVENPSRMSNRRIYETIGVRYDDGQKVHLIVDDVKTMLREHKAIDENLTLIVNFNKFASSSLDFFIYCFTHTTNWVEFHEIKQDVLLKVLAIVEQHGAECAFPTSTLHLASAPAELVSAERTGGPAENIGVGDLPA